MIGDHDPEDAWTATDPVHVQLGNLVDRVRLVRDRLVDRELSDRLQRVLDDLALIRDRVVQRDLD